MLLRPDLSLTLKAFCLGGVLSVDLKKKNISMQPAIVAHARVEWIVNPHGRFIYDSFRETGCFSDAGFPV